MVDDDDDKGNDDNDDGHCGSDKDGGCDTDDGKVEGDGGYGHDDYDNADKLREMKMTRTVMEFSQTMKDPCSTWRIFGKLL